MKLQEFFRAVINAGTQCHVLWVSGETRPYNEPDEFRDRLLLQLHSAPVAELVALLQELTSIGLVYPSTIAGWDLTNDQWQRQSIQRDPQWIELFINIAALAAYHEWSWDVEDTVADIDHLIGL